MAKSKRLKTKKIKPVVENKSGDKSRSREKSSTKSLKKTSLHPVGLSLYLSLFLMVFLYVFHHIPFYETFFFLTGVFFFFYLPGRLVIYFTGGEENDAPTFFLSLLAGMGVSSFLYYFFRLFEAGAIFPIIPLLSGAGLVYIYKKQLLDFKASFFSEKGEGKSPFGEIVPAVAFQKSAPVIFLFGVILLLLYLSHFTDVVFLKNGGLMIRNFHMTETVFHLGIADNLKYNLPPLYPYASGTELAYHIDLHLAAEMFHRFLGVRVMVMIFYFLPLLYFVFFAALPALLFYRLNKSVLLAAFAGLTVFMTDFSFIPGLWMNYRPEYPFSRIFITTIWSFFTMNGIMPATAFMFGSCFAVERFFKTGKTGFLILFAVFTISALRVKSSMAPHMLAAVCPLAVYYFVIHKNRAALRILPMAAATGLYIIFELHRLSAKSPGVMKTFFDPLSNLAPAMEKIGFKGLAYAVHHPGLTTVHLMTMAFLIYFAGYMGLRLVMATQLIDVVKKRIEPVYLYMLCFFIIGNFIGEMVFIGNPEGKINNGGWFSTQALVIAGFFIPVFLCEFRNKKYFPLIMAVAAIICFITTADFLSIRHDGRYARITPAETDIVSRLDHLADENVMVMEALKKKPSLSANLSGRPAVLSYFRSFVSQNIPKEDLKRRYADVLMFYDQTKKTDRKKILNRYNVTHVVLEKPAHQFLKNEPFLKTIYENKTNALLKVINKS